MCCCLTAACGNQVHSCPGMHQCVYVICSVCVYLLFFFLSPGVPISVIPCFLFSFSSLSLFRPHPHSPVPHLSATDVSLPWLISAPLYSVSCVQLCSVHYAVISITTHVCYPMSAAACVQSSQ